MSYGSGSSFRTSWSGLPTKADVRDGSAGEVDVESLVPFDGVFESLRDVEEFRRACVDPETGTVAWPSGADLDPLVLYSKIKGIGVEELFSIRPAVGG